jgi:exodeoxyribonuclease VII small subunit
VGNEAGENAPTAGSGVTEPTSFEASVERLQQIVRELEGGELPLEQALRLFEEGMRVARSAQDKLDGAERRVDELLGVDEQGTARTRELQRERE